jgi:hypothetical protein
MRMGSFIPWIIKKFYKGRISPDLSMLAGLPRSICDVENLGIFSKSWLKEIFENTSIKREYEEDYKNINTLQIPEMTGGVNPGDRRALYYLVRHTKPAAILEIGTHV